MTEPSLIAPPSHIIPINEAIPMIREGRDLIGLSQTGSGKTYTMEGLPSDNLLMGILPRMMQLIFETISQGSSDIEFSVKCQYYQIYNEKIQNYDYGNLI